MDIQILDNLSKEIFPLILKATTTICCPKLPVVEPLGNAVLLEINQEYYLLSAGHLMNVNDFPKLIIPAKNDKMTFCNGRLITTYESFNDRNKIDLAVFKFSARQNKNIEGYYRFIKPNEIHLEHKPVETSSYLISGYPINNIIKKTGQPEYNAVPLQVLTSGVRKRTYKKFGFDISTHILVKLYGKVKPFLSRQKIKLRKPTGISGSGLWYVPDWNKLDIFGVPEHVLVGILTNNYVDQGFVVAVKIDFATELLRNEFGILSNKSKLLDINKNIRKVYSVDKP